MSPGPSARLLRHAPRERPALRPAQQMGSDYSTSPGRQDWGPCRHTPAPQRSTARSGRQAGPPGPSPPPLLRWPSLTQTGPPERSHRLPGRLPAPASLTPDAAHPPCRLGWGDPGTLRAGRWLHLRSRLRSLHGSALSAAALSWMRPSPPALGCPTNTEKEEGL